ncbi:MAG: peptidase M50 [Euryarchaeota archaeon]|nr:peptidase M50 [Euryarchaeota archaeon]
MCRHHADPRRNLHHRPSHGEYEPHVTWGHGRRRAGFHTSGTEVLHLIAAIVGLTIIFALYFSFSKTFAISGFDLGTILAVSALTSGTAFLLHELAHKFVAQYYGHWAEFRVQWWGLVLPIAIIAATQFPILFAAPGAVVISGWVRKNENGIISAAGPLTNLVIFTIAYPFTIGIGTSGSLSFAVAEVVMIINAVLGLFNLLPFGVLDGRKVMHWNLLAYIALVGLAITALMLSFGLITLP